MAGNGALRLLVLTFLAFSCVICFNVLPTSGTRNLLLLYETASADTRQMKTTVAMVEDDELIIHGRLDSEVINRDYPGTGANNNHTPKLPPGVRG